MNKDRRRPNPDYVTPRRGEVVGHMVEWVGGYPVYRTAVAQGGRKPPRWRRMSDKDYRKLFAN